MGLAATQVYTLGLVGLEIARQQHERVPTGYLGYGTHCITHDLLANEVVIRLLLTATERGLTPPWRSKYEATVPDEAGRPALEPDALLEVQDAAGARHQSVLEYHHEDHGGRARDKVERYERFYRDGRWQQAWGTDTMPTVLVSWTHHAVATGYQKAVAEAVRWGLRCRYLGKPWQSVISGEAPDLWRDFHTGEAVRLWTGHGLDGKIRVRS